MTLIKFHASKSLNGLCSTMLASVRGEFTDESRGPFAILLSGKYLLVYFLLLFVVIATLLLDISYRKCIEENKIHDDSRGNELYFEFYVLL